MRRGITFPVFALIFFLFFWINIPGRMADRIRSWAASSLNTQKTVVGQEGFKLQIENQNLRNQLEHAYEWIRAHCIDEWTQKRVGCLRDQLTRELTSLPAEVVYRTPSAWSSSLWINVGEESNAALGQRVVCKNSPVLAEGALVGVIDYVGSLQSRVRLITDSGLAPAVRATRGASQNRELSRHISALLHLLEKRADLDGAKEAVSLQLQTLQRKVGDSQEDSYFARGELHGSSAPLWRSRSPILKGIGFHLDGLNAKESALKEGDLLVTSGLDGVFPAGIPVGSVSWIKPALPSSYSYEIEVRPAAIHLNDLHTVFVLPPRSE